jgi:hypothetical protein
MVIAQGSDVIGPAVGFIVEVVRSRGFKMDVNLIEAMVITTVVFMNL